MAIFKYSHFILIYLISATTRSHGVVTLLSQIGRGIRFERLFVFIKISVWCQCINNLFQVKPKILMLIFCPTPVSHSVTFGECPYESLTDCILSFSNDSKQKDNHLIIYIIKMRLFSCNSILNKHSALRFLEFSHPGFLFEPTCFKVLLKLYSVTPSYLCF